MLTIDPQIQIALAKRLFGFSKHVRVTRLKVTPEEYGAVRTAVYLDHLMRGDYVHPELKPAFCGVPLERVCQ
jgi:hypothetical protein